MKRRPSSIRPERERETHCHAHTAERPGKRFGSFSRVFETVTGLSGTKACLTASVHHAAGHERAPRRSASSLRSQYSQRGGFSERTRRRLFLNSAPRAVTISPSRRRRTLFCVSAISFFGRFPCRSPIPARGLRCGCVFGVFLIHALRAMKYAPSGTKKAAPCHEVALSLIYNLRAAPRKEAHPRPGNMTLNRRRPRRLRHRPRIPAERARRRQTCKVHRIQRLGSFQGSR